MVDKKKYQRPAFDSQMESNSVGQIQENANTRPSVIDAFVEDTLKTVANVEDMDYDDLIDIDFD